MNIDKIIQKYFTHTKQLPLIEVFDGKNIHAVYSDVVSLLKNQPSIELGVLQILGYCLYEILDNVITHSEKNCGTVLTDFQVDRRTIRIAVVDDGIGIYQSLKRNKQYDSISESEALIKCIEDKVTDGEGMGFGLYSTALMIHSIGIQFEIHSGSHSLSFKDGEFNVSETTFWQGTIVYIELHADKEISPNDIIDNRTDVEAEFNDEFINIDEIEDLW